MSEYQYDCCEDRQRFKEERDAARAENEEWRKTWAEREESIHGVYRNHMADRDRLARELDAAKLDAELRERLADARRRDISFITAQNVDLALSLALAEKCVEAAREVRRRKHSGGPFTCQCDICVALAAYDAARGEPEAKPAREFTLRGGTAHCPSFIHEGQAQLRDDEEIRVREMKP